MASSPKPRKRRKSSRAKRGIHQSSKCLLPINYRSGWELKYALWLDAQLDVSSYRYEPYAISYVSNKRTGRKRKYYPDFEVTRSDGSLILVEIKPKKKMTVVKNVKKFAAAQAFCLLRNMTFSVITEVDLKRLGLL